jgi:hypothetical protein
MSQLWLSITPIIKGDNKIHPDPELLGWEIFLSGLHQPRLISIFLVETIHLTWEVRHKALECNINKANTERAPTARVPIQALMPATSAGGLAE